MEISRQSERVDELAGTFFVALLPREKMLTANTRVITISARTIPDVSYRHGRRLVSYKGHAIVELTNKASKIFFRPAIDFVEEKCRTNASICVYLLIQLLNQNYNTVYSY